MTPIARTLREVLAIIPGSAPIALVGGLAVSARSEPRFTRDIDFAVAVPTDAEAEAMVHRLIQAGFSTDAVLEDTRRGRLATMRLRRTPRAPIVDLLFSSCGIEPEVVADATKLSVLGHVVPVACTGHLIAMKLIARDDRRRPQDAVDLHALGAVADATEWNRAQAAVELVIERGFARDRDLRAALAEWRRGATSTAE